VAATFVFKLGGLDLSAYLRVNPDDTNPMDPEGAPWAEPAFSETPFADSQVLISTTINNRESMWPLYIRDPTLLKDALHVLMRAINNAAQQRPLVLEWRDDGASASTFFNVVFARFEPSFNFRRSQHGYAAGVLHCWVAGYGDTGTTRIAATAAGTGIFLSVPIASLAGDAPALLVTNITDGGVVPSLGRIVAVAGITQPSYTPQIPAASLTSLQPGATVIGASGADGSQYLALPVAPTGGASGIACKVPLPNPTIAGGDNRILAVVRSGIDAGVAINAIDPYGNAMGGTAVASMSQSWGVIDLGVCRLPTVGYPTQPQISIQAGAIWASGAAGPLILASPAGLALNEIFCLPDKNLALILESQAAGGGASVLSRDSFNGGAGVGLDGRNDSVGNPWSDAYNNVGGASLVLTELNPPQLALSPIGAAASIPASALDSAHLPGILTDTMLISAKPQFTTIGGEVDLLKESASGAYVQARVNRDTGFLDLSAATSGALNLIASVAVASINNIKLRLSLQCQGGAALVNLTRDDAGPLLVAAASSAFASLGASSAALSGAGMPGLTLQQGGTSDGKGVGRPHVFSWEVDSLPFSASTGLAPFDTYTIDGVAADSYRTSSAGVFSGQKLVAQQRGAFPKLQPSTTSVAVIAAAFDQGVANDLISAVVSIRERYIYGK
jgi:hypothetical protein